MVLAILSLLTGLTEIAEAGGDPSGAATFTDDVAGLKLAVNFAWTLVTGFLVFFMQAGFAMLGGLLRKKCMTNYLTKSYMDFSAGALTYWLFGFALMFGGSALGSGLDKGNWFIGYSGWLLLGDAYDVVTMEVWLFQMMFAATAATIVAGLCAERLKFQAYLVYSFFVCGIIYPIYGHWVWGGGWLATLPFGVGARDFAGSGVVHSIGGLVGLAGAIALGPRIGKFTADGKPVAIPGHNLTFVVLGTFILFFGWFGFNPGSTLAATDLRISAIAVNTFLAGALGAITIAYLTYGVTGKADLGLICNGALGGLVAITAPCAYVHPWGAVCIGIIAGFVMMYTNKLLEVVCKIDDPVGAAGVHAANGIWGILAVGIFADGSYGGVNGLITGSAWQLLAQIIDAIATIAWALGLGFFIFYLLKATIGIRVEPEIELEGLDIHEHGTPCYPEDAIKV
ncbi:MAG: ammonium transporter [Planctomycetes bacterium]|nr:ammonium transporter [Planctomycetota bacterium]MBI4007590.1 ammonium transporter [Planctomycetota bacterium]